MKVSKIENEPKTVVLCLDNDLKLRRVEPGYKPQKGEEVFGVTYRPGRVTPRAEERMLEARTKREGYIGAIAETLGSILVEWEVTDEDERPIEPTYENLSALPGDFLAGVAAAIFGGEREDPEADAPSSSG